MYIMMDYTGLEPNSSVSKGHGHNYIIIMQLYSHCTMQVGEVMYMYIVGVISCLPHNTAPQYP